MPVDPRIQRALDEPFARPGHLRFTPVKGYAQPPGTGPVGSHCRTCRHAVPTSCSGWQHVCALDGSRPPVTIKLETAGCSRWERPSR